MKKINNIFLVIILTILCFNSYGQYDDYKYKTELSGISDQWHKIVLPDEIFSKLQADISDIKIIGITDANDTIESPYLLQLATEKVTIKDIEFNLINQTRNARGHYFTFEVSDDISINQIDLDFDVNNFDWKIKLEGSNDQQEWFTIIDDYRILSISNSYTDYSYSKLNFPKSKYRYFRIMINNNKDLINLNLATISHYEIEEGSYKNYKIINQTIDENKDNNETIIELKLENKVPLSKLKINVKNDYDFYRPITIQYLTDSFKTQNGWKYAYSVLGSGTLTSIEDNTFKFKNTVAQNLKIVIQNYDNEALDIGEIEVKGNVHELIARFTETADYFLIYGNKNADYSYYDINHFRDNIPEDLSELKLGDEQIQIKKEVKESEPLFKNKTWLWIVMAVILLMLGWFSLRMIMKK